MPLHDQLFMFYHHLSLWGMCFSFSFLDVRVETRLLSRCYGRTDGRSMKWEGGFVARPWFDTRPTTGEQVSVGRMSCWDLRAIFSSFPGRLSVCLPALLKEEACSERALQRVQISKVEKCNDWLKRFRAKCLRYNLVFLGISRYWNISRLSKYAYESYILSPSSFRLNKCRD